MAHVKLGRFNSHQAQKGEGTFRGRAECMEEARKHPLPLVLRFRYLPGCIIGFLTFPKRDAVLLRNSSGTVNKIVTCQRRVGWGEGGFPHKLKLGYIMRKQFVKCKQEKNLNQH